MTLFFSILVFFNFLKAEDCRPAPKNNPIWYDCKKDSDCVLDKGVCDHPMSYNKKYTAPVRYFIKCQSYTVDCAIQEQFEAVATCKENKCVAEAKK